VQDPGQWFVLTFEFGKGKAGAVKNDGRVGGIAQRGNGQVGVQAGGRQIEKMWYQIRPGGVMAGEHTRKLPWTVCCLCRCRPAKHVRRRGQTVKTGGVDGS